MTRKKAGSKRMMTKYKITTALVFEFIKQDKLDDQGMSY